MLSVGVLPLLSMKIQFLNNTFLNNFNVKTTLLYLIKKSLFFCSFLFLTQISKAQIASWTYEPLQGTIANPTSNIGSGTSSVINFGGGTVTAGTGCGAQSGVTAWALNPFDGGSTNESNGVQFNSTTVGYQNIFFYLGPTMVEHRSQYCPFAIYYRWSNLGSF